MATLAQVIKANAPIKALGQNYPAIAAALNAPTTVANPVTKAPKVGRSITLLDIFGTIAAAAPADLAKAGSIPDWMIDRAESAMQENDRVAMANWLVSIGATIGLSQAGKDALNALLSATVDDPNWSATVAGPSIAQAAGLGTVTAEQVQACDVSGGKW